MSTTSAARIIGLGCATPEGVSSQQHSARFGIEMAGLTGDSARLAEAVYARSGIAHRSSALLTMPASSTEPARQSFYEQPCSPVDRGPTTAARMRAYAALAPVLAQRAAERAITDAVDTLGHQAAAAITHLVIVSCTGFSAPGLDVVLVRALGLSPTVERLTIGFMGCHGGVVGLRTARALAVAAHPASEANVLLVCVELCSLHFQYSSRPDQIVANALFGDGAAAVVVSNGRAGDCSSRGRSLTIQSSASRVFPASEEVMGWIIGDHGFEMTLRESVPDLIRGELGPWLSAWLESCGLSSGPMGDRALWAIHPGGPKVLQAFGDALALDAPALACSRAILYDHGNMSSPTVLFTIERLLGMAREVDSVKPIVVIGFGPGLTAEAVLLVP